MIRFGSYNMLDLYCTDTSSERERRSLVVEVIRSLDLDVLAVQELIATAPDGLGGAEAEEATDQLAGERLRELADQAGLKCEYAPGRPTVAIGSHGFHTGLMWRPGITPVSGSWRAYGSTDLWHALAALQLDVGGPVPIQHAAYHGPPFGKHRRADEAERVVGIMTRPAIPGLVAGDWNTVSADRVERPGYDEPTTAEHYDPDPYTHRPWHPDFVYQTRWRRDPWGHIEHWEADRDPGEILYTAGLRDVAALLNAPWQATVGHWRGDSLGARRIDAIRITRHLTAAMRGYEVADTEHARIASDHLPIVATYDETAMLSPADDGKDLRG